jgi:hypothetical protein
MESRQVISTSKVTAKVEDFTLRETKSTRLIFRPTLVENDNDENASVNGEFLFQKKGFKDKWEDFESVPFSKMKNGEEVKLKIKSGELLSLHEEITNLYKLYKIDGIPQGETQFIKAKGSLKAITTLTDTQLSELIQGEENIGIEAVARLINWASTANNFSLIFERLDKLDPESLSNLNTAIGISALKTALIDWKNNRKESAEKVWQKLLAKHTFILEQLFHYPIVIIDESAYVGGKTVFNKEGSLLTF